MALVTYKSFQPHAKVTGFDGEQWMTWLDYIGLGWKVTQERMKADWKGIWDYALPHVRATEEEVARTEETLGFRLPDSYRGFLLASNGWPCFYQDMTIFSTDDLLGGPLYDAGRIPLDLPECVESMAIDGVVAADYFTVAASETQNDVALLGRPGTPAEGTVTWWGGEVMDRYKDFLEYYLSMLEYNKLDIEDIREKDGPKPDGVIHAVLGDNPYDDGVIILPRSAAERT